MRKNEVKRNRGNLRILGAILLCIVCFVIYQMGWLRPMDPSKLLRYEPGSYKVTQFLDGDTVIVDMNGTAETIRFIGIDTPETHKPNTPVQCYGPAASAYTKSRIGEGGRVRLVADRLTTNRDRYDRLLRYVYLLDGTNLNKELVAKGYAFAYDFPFADSQAFHDTQAIAQKIPHRFVGQLQADSKPSYRSMAQQHRRYECPVTNQLLAIRCISGYAASQKAIQENVEGTR